MRKNLTYKRNNKEKQLLVKIIVGQLEKNGGWDREDNALIKLFSSSA